MLVHIENSITLSLYPDIHQYTKLRVEQLAKPLEEKHMRVQLPRVFVFNAKEKIVVLLLLGVIDQAAKLFLCILLVPRVLEVILLHTHRV